MDQNKPPKYNIVNIFVIMGEAKIRNLGIFLSIVFLVLKMAHFCVHSNVTRADEHLAE